MWNSTACFYCIIIVNIFYWHFVRQCLCCVN